MRRLQQRLLLFVLPALSKSIAQRFGANAIHIARSGVHALLSMSVVDGNLHQKEINDAKQFMSLLRDNHLMTMDDYDRFVDMFQSRVKRTAEVEILKWASGLPVELWRTYHTTKHKPARSLTEHQILQDQITFTLSGLALVSYAGLYALVSDQEVHSAELRLLNQIMYSFENPEALFRHLQDESSLSVLQKNILQHEIRRYVQEFVNANLLPLTLIQHVIHTDPLRTASETDLRWVTIVDEITEINTRIIDDMRYFTETKSFVAYEQTRLPLPGVIEQQRLDFLPEGDLTVDSISAITKFIEDEEERVEVASQLHDMAINTFGGIVQTDTHSGDSKKSTLAVSPSIPSWQGVILRLMDASKVTYELIEELIATHVDLQERLAAYQYVLEQLYKNGIPIYDGFATNDITASDNLTIKDVQSLVSDINTRMNQSLFAQYKVDYEHTYFYHALLSPGEERDLCVARAMLKDLRDQTNQQQELYQIEQLDNDVRNLLINHNYRLVMRIAMSHLVYVYQLEKMDLFQEGCVGLIKAVDKFDTSKNTRLSTYATWWIRQSITRAIDDFDRSIRLPVHFLESIRRYNRMVLAYEKEHHGMSPTHEVVAERLHISLGDVAQLAYWNQRIMSLNTPVGEDTSSSLADYLEDDADISYTAEQTLLAERIEHILKEFEERDRLIIIYRFGLDQGGIRTLGQIGQMFNLSRERVRQIESQTLKAIRSSNQDLVDFI